MTQLDELVELLSTVGDETPSTRATSLRLPERVHRAAVLATELGMDASLTQATSQALLDRVHAFVRERSLAEHFAAFPADVPELADVVRRRINGTDHPGVDRDDLVAATAAWVERHEPDWALAGRIDVTVDRVLDHVELLAAGVGRAAGSPA